MTKIIQRHDTAANWASANPVLAQGEMGIEDDTRKFKFGDGTTAWADLPYASSEGGGGTGGSIATTNTAGIVKPDGTTISVTEDGTISSIPPANMITTGNIAADPTIQGLTNGKLDIDATLLSATGKSTISALSFPSNRYIDLTLGASGSTYTAPANGWFAFAKKATAASQIFQVRNTTANFIVNNMSVSAGYVDLFLPFQKGQICQIDYSGTGETAYFRFIYAEGSESEAK